jgi:mannose-6-phosphate isomerase-like protein (cupin superfamily)
VIERTDVKKLINFSKEEHTKVIFYDKGSLKAQIMCLQSGQLIPPCKMQNDVLFYVIEGKGEIIIDSEREALTTGICVVVPKFAESRSISAKSDLIILAVQAKEGGIE